MKTTAPDVAQILKEEGITEAELAEMVRRSSVYSKSERGNRRFHDWIFDIRDGKCHAMSRLEHTVIGRGKTPMFEEHADCEGEGCKECGWIGEVKRLV